MKKAFCILLSILIIFVSALPAGAEDDSFPASSGNESADAAEPAAEDGEEPAAEEGTASGQEAEDAVSQEGSAEGRDAAGQGTAPDMTDADRTETARAAAPASGTETPEKETEEPPQDTEGEEDEADAEERPAAPEKVLMPEPWENTDDGTMIVVFEEGTAVSEIESVVEEADLSAEAELITEGSSLPSDAPAASVTITEEGSFEEAAAEIAASPEVAYVQPNYIYELLGDHIDTGTSEMNSTYNNWHLAAMSVPAAWEYSRTDQAVTVAVVDTGCDLLHEDLIANLDLANAYQAVNRTDDQGVPANYRISFRKTTDQETGNTTTIYFEFNGMSAGQLTQDVGTRGDMATKAGNAGHGTHVCGIIGARANNDAGIAGVSYNAKVLPVNVFNRVARVVSVTKGQDGTVLDETDVTTSSSYISYVGTHYTTTKDVISGFDYLIGNASSFDDLRVVNLSFGGYTSSSSDQLLADKIDAARSLGIVTVCAGGNRSSSERNFPADYDSCVSVCALSKEGWESAPAVWGSSDHNQYKDITAPGELIYSTMLNGVYTTKSGTSMAAPCVSGVLALMFAADPSLDADEAVQILYETAADIGDPGWDEVSGWGLVDAEAAVRTIADPAYQKIPSDEIEDRGIYTIVPAVNTDKALDIQSGSTALKGNLQIYRRNGSDAQKFIAFRNGDGSYTICNYKSGYAIDVANGSVAEGSNVWQYNWNGSAAQHWDFDYDSKGGTYRIRSKKSGKRLTVEGDASQNGANVAISSSDSVREKFYLVRTGTAPLSAGTYTLRALADQRFTLDIAGGKSTAKTNVQIWKANGSKAQKFTIVPSLAGTYEIRTFCGLALDAQGGGTAPKTNVWQYTRNRSAAQRWIVTAAGTNAYTLKNEKGGICLDISGGKYAAGTNVWLYRPNGSAAQKWVLKPA